ncbi:MAG: transcription antitermination factor NusB [Oscillospiraceae bacterium]|nr:transcription antitermination factor NusB [Oscillospiraceae bacterium]
MKRREAREAAFLLTYQRSVRNDAIDEIIESAVEGDAFELNDFAKELVTLCDEHLEEIDEAIERNMQNWKINRLSKLTLGALRIAVCELMYRPDVPVAVTINEVIEILKKYASEEDAAFLNGVLGAVVKNEDIKKDSDAKEED